MQNTGWWITTGVGITLGLLTAISQNCQFGPQVCQIIAALVTVGAPVLGISHSGNFNITPKV
jgi:hypothetical protein